MILHSPQMTALGWWKVICKKYISTVKCKKPVYNIFMVFFLQAFSIFSGIKRLITISY